MYQRRFGWAWDLKILRVVYCVLVSPRARNPRGSTKTIGGPAPRYNFPSWKNFYGSPYPCCILVLCNLKSSHGKLKRRGPFANTAWNSKLGTANRSRMNIAASETIRPQHLPPHSRTTMSHKLWRNSPCNHKDKVKRSQGITMGQGVTRRFIEYNKDHWKTREWRSYTVCITKRT